MKQELDRIKNDLETIQRAMGLAPAMGREWIQWMKRDKWFNLWWCLPGFILIAAALLPFDHAQRYLGLGSNQWAGVLVSAAMIAITVVYTRRIGGKDGRPAAMVRQRKRINGMTAEGLWFSLGLLAQLLFYFAWGKHYRVGFEPFWAGLWLILGSSCLIAAIASRAWILLGWAIPFLAYGLCLPLAEGHNKINGVLLGMMFIAVAFSFSVVQAWEIRKIENQHDTD
jgi:hypothetical protein